MAINSAKIASASTPERTELNVERALQDLASAKDSLLEAVYSISSRLSPLLSPEPDNVPCCERPRGESDVSESILFYADEVRICTSKIYELIGRL